MAKQIWTFLVLAFAFSWIIWFTALKFGAAPGTGEYILAFGSAGPAFAAILLSRTRAPCSDRRSSLRLLSLVLFWALAWSVYIENDSLRGVHPSSQTAYRMVVGLLAFVSAWIISGSFSRDSGVRQLLSTLLRPNVRMAVRRPSIFPCDSAHSGGGREILW